MQRTKCFLYLPGVTGSSFVSKSVFCISNGINVFGMGGAPILYTFMSENLITQVCG